VQEIAWEQQPILYLLNRDALTGVSPAVRNLRPSSMHPRLVWNIEEISLAASR